MLGDRHSQWEMVEESVNVGHFTFFKVGSEEKLREFVAKVEKVLKHLQHEKISELLNCFKVEACTVEGHIWVGIDLKKANSDLVIDWKRVGLNQNDPNDLKLIRHFIATKKVENLINILIDYKKQRMFNSHIGEKQLKCMVVKKM